MYEKSINSCITIIVAVHKQSSELQRFIDWAEDNFNYRSKFKFLIKDSGFNRHILERISDSEFIEYISREDSGIYDAWNQAIQSVTTNYVMFLGVTDRIDINVEGSDLDFSEYDVLYFDFLVKRADKCIPVSVARRDMLRHFPIRPGFCFSAAVFQSKYLKSHLFNAKLTILGDFDFLLRNRRFIRCRYWANGPLVIFEDGGVSNNRKSLPRRMSEYRRVIVEIPFSRFHYLTYCTISYMKVLYLPWRHRSI